MPMAALELWPQQPTQMHQCTLVVCHCVLHSHCRGATCMQSHGHVVWHPDFAAGWCPDTSVGPKRGAAHMLASSLPGPSHLVGCKNRGLHAAQPAAAQCQQQCNSAPQMHAAHGGRRLQLQGPAAAPALASPAAVGGSPVLHHCCLKSRPLLLVLHLAAMVLVAAASLC